MEPNNDEKCNGDYGKTRRGGHHTLPRRKQATRERENIPRKRSGRDMEELEGHRLVFWKMFQPVKESAGNGISARCCKKLRFLELKFQSWPFQKNGLMGQEDEDGEEVEAKAEPEPEPELSPSSGNSC